jgi:hypothetical protein
MKFSTEILEELNKVSPLLAGIEKKNVFSVPEGYFDVLSIDILKKIQIDSGTKTHKLTVPEGYFENLGTSVLTKIRSLKEDNPAQELRALSPMLYSIQNENVFSAPVGYFRDLQNEILYKVKPQAKVVELRKRSSVWKYAAAAVVTGIIGLSSLMMFNTSKTSADNTDTELLIQTASQFKNEEQINGAIATLSEEEIIKYLERTGTDIDNEALATGIDASELPESTDYMLDEKTLETYLNTDRNSQN